MIVSGVGNVVFVVVISNLEYIFFSVSVKQRNIKIIDNVFFANMVTFVQWLLDLLF